MARSSCPPCPRLPSARDLIRAGDGYRPLLVWDVPGTPAENGATFLALSRGKLILDNLDFVVQWPGEVPAVWFDLGSSDFFARDCTFSAASKAGQAVALVRRKATPTPVDHAPQTWLQHCYLRGPEVTLLQLIGSGGNCLVEESLIVGQQQPLIQMRCGNHDPLSLYCVRSTLAAGRGVLHWEPVSRQGRQAAHQGAGARFDPDPVRRRRAGRGDA